MEVFDNKSYEIKKSDLLEQIAEIESQISGKEHYINDIKEYDDMSPTSKRKNILSEQSEIINLKKEINEIQSQLRHLEYRKIEYDVKTNPDKYKDEFLKYKYLNDYYRQKEEIDFFNLENETYEIALEYGRISGEYTAEAMKTFLENKGDILLNQEGREDKLKKLEDRLKNHMGDKFDESLINYQSFSDMYNENYTEKHTNVVYKAAILDTGESNESYTELVNEKIEAYTKGLNGDEKELAEVWAHLENMDFVFNEGEEEEVSLTGTYINDITKIGENKYIARYGEIGAEVVKDPKTNEFIVTKYNEIAKDKNNETQKNINKSINNKQIEMQYAKHRIGQNLGIEINEITEIQDEKLSKYFLDQNGLFENDGMFMISYIDDEGKNNYKFVGWDEEIGGYKELSGLNQVPVTKNINYEMPGSNVYLMRPAEVQFCDINGKNIFMHHQMGTGNIELGYDKADFQKDGEGKIKTEDYGINKLLHNSRVVDLFKAGYNALGVGIEEVKKLYSELRGKENVNEKTNTTEEQGR